MNTYIKYFPNVFIAKCDEKHEKGDVIILTSKYGKETEHIVHNFLGYTGTKENTMFCYSITRADGFNNQERAKQKVEKLNGYAENADKRSLDLIEKSHEGQDFLALGEPIKVGHHSEKRHRALIDRNWKRMGQAVAEMDKAEAYRQRTAYWEALEGKIDLSMPESLEFFIEQLTDAKDYHQFLKDNPSERPHSFALTYAGKKVKDLTSKVEFAKKLWS